MMRHAKSSLTTLAALLMGALLVGSVSSEALAQESGGKPRKPGKTQPAKTRPAKAQPAKAQPAKAQPAKAQPAKAQPAAPKELAVAPPSEEAPVAQEPFKGILGALVGVLTPERREALGAPASAGIHVSKILPGSIAEVAGVSPGDVIIDVGGQPVTSTDDVAASLAQKHIGDLLTVQVIRDGKPKTLAVTLAPQVNAVEGSAQQPPAKANLDGELHFGSGEPGAPDGANKSEGRKERRIKRLHRRIQWLKNRIRRHHAAPRHRVLYR
jgi:membrane-associated protease RseP (regulator of RpoE activity)